jgi:hypothetical protein
MRFLLFRGEQERKRNGVRLRMRRPSGASTENPGRHTAVKVKGRFIPLSLVR